MKATYTKIVIVGQWKKAVQWLISVLKQIKFKWQNGS